jgi:hypothetical protein
LSRSKEDSVPFLRELAGAGFDAVGFDAWRHGERAAETGEEILERVFGGFRRHMWPILGQTTLDALRVIDWTIASLGAAPEVVAAACRWAGTSPWRWRASTSGWRGWPRSFPRPIGPVRGCAISPTPSRILEQGEADAYARWFYERLDPLTHVEAYAPGPAIAFECGADDIHVPADGTQRFRAALHEAYPNAAERVRVTVHAGVGHIDGGRSEALLRRCLAWFEP